MSDKHIDQAAILERANGLYVAREGGNNYLRLTNFHVRVTKEVILEGIKTSSVFTVWLGIPIPSSEKPEDDFKYSEECYLEVEGKEFHSGKWIGRLGSQYVTYPMQGKEGYINVAAAMLNPFKPKEIVKACSMIGFKKLPNNQLVYVSGNSIVGDNSGIEAIPLSNGKLSKYGLKQTNQYSIHQSFENSLKFLELGDARITVPLWLATLRAPLCYWKSFPGIIKLVGRTGTFKSSIVAAAMSHFGSFRTNVDLPIKWSFTKTAVEILLSLLRDTVVCIDDYNPEATRTAKDSMLNTLSLIIGEVSDGIGKARAKADMTLHDTHNIRCVIVSTAEELPPLPESRQARVLIIDMSQIRTVYKDELYSYDPSPNTVLMEAYIKWLIENPPTDLDELLKYYHDKIEREATLYHERTAGLYAHLMLGLVIFERFLKATGNCEINKETWEVIHTALVNVCLLQNPPDVEVGEDKKSNIDLFMEGIRESINGNQSHLLGASKHQATLGNDRKEYLGYYDERYVYLSFYATLTHINDRRAKVGLTEISCRQLASDLRSERGIEVSRVIRVNKETVIRACKLTFEEVFALRD